MSLKLKLILIIGGSLIAINVVAVYFIIQKSTVLLNEKAMSDGREKVISIRQVNNLYFNRIQEDLDNLSNDADVIRVLEGGSEKDLVQVIVKFTDIRNTVAVLEDIVLQKISGSKCTAVSSDQFATSLVGRDFSDRDYCKGIISTKAPYISGVFNSAISGNSVLGVATPVKNTQGDVLGFVVGIVDLSSLRGYIWDLQNNGSYTVLFDRYGQLFLDTRSVQDRSNSIFDVVDEIAKAKAQYGFLTHQEHLMSYDRMDFATIILFEQSKKSFELVGQITSLIVLTNIFAIVLLLCVVIIVISRLTERLKVIAEVVKRNSISKQLNRIEGKYEKYGDEVGVLSTVFNQMIDTMRNYQKGLNKLVEERTKKLAISEEKLRKSLQEADRINKIMVGRELRMVELKKGSAKNKMDKKNEN